jgi:RimJ/RimL family protein N-acetyltransferase
MTLETARLILKPKTLAEVRADIEQMTAAERAQLSADWLAQLENPAVSLWTLGFAVVLQSSNAIIGGCGFKGPAGDDGAVEIAYGLREEYQGQGYASEAAAALTRFALDHPHVKIVRAHTLSQVGASARILTKCGFRLVGQVVDPEDGPVWRWEIARV